MPKAGGTASRDADEGTHPGETPMRPFACLLAAFAVVVTPAAPLRADEPDPQLVLTTLSPTNPCGFFRNQAFGKGLSDPATEMLWACQEIATRRAAEIPLGVRLEATELALMRYREALLVASRGSYATDSGRGPTSTYPSASDKHAIAETTGVLAALMAISGGY
jgi:hypothetical protein